MRINSWTAIWVVVGGVAALVTCTVDPVDLGGLECDAGNCLDGYTCDVATNICVTVGDPCDDDRRRLPCQAGKTCDQGCRTCLDGQWTDCEAGPVCDANSVACDGAELVSCDAGGEEAMRQDCGAPGCNSSTGTHWCNECVPSTTRCSGLFATPCDSTGLQGAPIDCNDGDGCTSDSCVDGTGCSNIPDLCPCTNDVDCDDSNDCTDDTCNASDCAYAFNTDPCVDSDKCITGDTCSGGVCMPGAVIVDCSDGLACTDDLCSPTDGSCTHPTDDNNACSDDGNPCTPSHMCVAGLCTGSGTTNCSGTETDCSGPMTCDPTGASDNCDVPGVPFNTGGSCNGCAGCTCFYGFCTDPAGEKLSNLPPGFNPCSNGASLDITSSTAIDTGTVGKNPTLGGTPVTAPAYVGIDRSEHSLPGIAVFVYNSINVNSGQTVTITGSRAAVFVSCTTIVIAGDVIASGGNGTQSTTSGGGAGGPGGFDGGGFQGDGKNGFPGGGPGGGFGGVRGSDPEAGGGGGGSYGGFGGNGGTGRTTGIGGRGGDGGAYPNSATLEPIIGGSGGGAGGDGAAGSGGGGGGGGGGAVQFVAVESITVEGDIFANGGGGSGESGNHGAGGGASGGAILLEAPQVTLTTSGRLGVEGGDGGDNSGAGGGKGDGGLGAVGGSVDGEDGTDDDNDGGGGGGGSCGRIRINTTGGATLDGTYMDGGACFSEGWLP